MVLPACAGMNRITGRPGIHPELVLPACAGMNRIIQDEVLARFGAPRMRGDEPLLVPACTSHSRCSPHARG